MILPEKAAKTKWTDLRFDEEFLSFDEQDIYAHRNLGSLPVM